MTAETYNGWRNRSTWLVNLWIDNDGYAGGADEVAEQAAERLDEYAERDDAVSGLAEYLKDRIDFDLFDEEMNPTPPKGLASDLMRQCLREVDWYEIARYYVAQEEFERAQTGIEVLHA